MVSTGTSAAYGAGRVTPQRRLIAETAASMRGAFSVEDLVHAMCSTDTAAGIATVYRAVSAMLASGWLERVGERDGRALFARCRAGARHHHHVICESCGRVEATGCPVVLAPRVASDFVIARHEVTLYGLCPECVARNATGGRR